MLPPYFLFESIVVNGTRANCSPVAEQAQCRKFAWK